MKLKCLECGADAEYVHVHQGFGGSFCKKHYKEFFKFLKLRTEGKKEYLQKLLEPESKDDANTTKTKG